MFEPFLPAEVEQCLIAMSWATPYAAAGHIFHQAAGQQQAAGTRAV
jgi:hypothetical protein